MSLALSLLLNQLNWKQLMQFLTGLFIIPIVPVSFYLTSLCMRKWVKQKSTFYSTPVLCIRQKKVSGRYIGKRMLIVQSVEKKLTGEENRFLRNVEGFVCEKENFSYCVHHTAYCVLVGLFRDQHLPVIILSCQLKLS